MWELTVIGKKDDKIFIDSMIEDIARAYSWCDIYHATATRDEDYVCSFATDETKVLKNDSVIEYINLSVAQNMLAILKKEYFSEHLHLPHVSNKLKKFMIDVLIPIGSLSEVETILDRLDSDTINIRSFGIFKLKDMMDSWEELADRLSRALSDLDDEERVYQDFLKYMASIIEGEEPIYIYIDDIEGWILSRDIDGEDLYDIIPMDNDIEFMVSILNYSPASIYIKNPERLDKDMLDSIKYIFGDKIKEYI